MLCSRTGINSCAENAPIPVDRSHLSSRSVNLPSPFSALSKYNLPPAHSCSSAYPVAFANPQAKPFSAIGSAPREVSACASQLRLVNA
eukprot:5776910-Pleurochrysis_carterae.AAC.6